MRNSVRIAVVGDAGVGKTSIVSSFAGGSFADKVESVLPPVELPAETSPDNVAIKIIDTPSGEDNALEVKNQIKEADAIVLVYSVDNDETLANVTQLWLPVINKLAPDTPILLVGNKVDMRSSSSTAQSTLRELITPILEEYKKVEICIECSARQMLNISEVFYFAHKAILHPVHPLMNVEDNELTPHCKAALKRIFMTCDKDKDGLLNDSELNAYQKYCYGNPLSEKELEGVKAILADNLGKDKGLSGERASITLDGFFFLSQHFVERGRPETIWMSLRKYGYDDSICLSDSAVSMDSLSGSGVRLALTQNGASFVKGVFARADQDRDGVLSTPELKELLSTCPHLPTRWTEELSFPLGLQHTSTELITADGLLSAMAELLSAAPIEGMKYLLYFGYDGKMEEAVTRVDSAYTAFSSGLPVVPARAVVLASRDDFKVVHKLAAALTCEGKWEKDDSIRHGVGLVSSKVGDTTASFALSLEVEMFDKAVQDPSLYQSGDIVMIPVACDNPMNVTVFKARTMNFMRGDVPPMFAVISKQKGEPDLVEQVVKFVKEKGIPHVLMSDANTREALAEAAALSVQKRQKKVEAPAGESKKSEFPTMMVVGIGAAVVAVGVAAFFALGGSSGSGSSGSSKGIGAMRK
mmetsp:Transcript_47898/g.124347  ORF Transcript_47898/g.124347 Transcript_47898/m.124347 type:complete len:641 (-) Transcript_47898:37-1959(-)